jgi:hypothetical protein
MGRQDDRSFRHSLLGERLAALVKVDGGREEIDRGNSHAEVSFLR